MNTNDPSQRVTTVYLLRHGQTTYNISSRLRGRADLELTATGRVQAEALGQLFAGIVLSRAVSSPLQRALKTAEPVARAAGLRVETMDGLNDRDYGEWTGVERSEVLRRFGTIDAAPGVEPWDALCQRVKQAFDSLLATSSGPAIAIVGHDATNRALLAGLIPKLSKAPEDIPQANGCWNRIEWNCGHWMLTVLNATPGDGQHP
ncbi:MAG TPA: histidine phosphatase family protein [Nitrosospira sp.]|nr:histidine phosphatase family protein [Nitrosospira sp.]